MSDIKTFNPDFDKERQDRIRYFIELFEKGLDDENIIGYHGTSLEVVNGVINDGAIRGGYGGHFERKIGVLPKQISFFKRGAKVAPFSVPKHKDDEPLRAASGYAQVLGQTHGAMRKLGFSLDDENLRNLVSDENLQEDLMSQGKLSKEEVKRINQVWGTMEHREGVVLGFHKDMLKDFKIRPPISADEKGEVVIICPQGIDYKYIVGIEPEGDYEWEYFESLQKSIGR